MPLYSYKCENCNKIWDAVNTVERRNAEVCECGGKAIINFEAFGSRNIMTFTPHTYEDICEYPIHITSKSQLKRECAKHNVRAARLM